MPMAGGADVRSLAKTCCYRGCSFSWQDSGAKEECVQLATVDRLGRCEGLMSFGDVVTRPRVSKRAWQMGLGGVLASR
jgi:hypothetical protein